MYFSIKNSLLILVSDMCLLQSWFFYQRPGSLRVLRRILAVSMIALFWTKISDVVPSIGWSYS